MMKNELYDNFSERERDEARDAPTLARELQRLRAEHEALQATLEDLKLLYEATIEHGETVENMLAENNTLLQHAQERLDDAINAISEGFSLYGPDDRLVIANARYREILFAGDASFVEPGKSFEAIMRAAIDSGFILDAGFDPEAWLAERLERHRNPGETHLERYANGRWVRVSERRTHDGGVVAVYSDVTELKRREQELDAKSTQLEQLSSQLAKYLSPQVYNSIFEGRQEVKIAATRKKLTVFFSDIANFTETADRLESEELTQLLNQYLTEMSKIALEYGATIDKFVGDAILIFFGDPETRGVREDALACVRMAIAMQERLIALQHMWRDAGIARPLQCRMGIHTDFCTVGNFGSEDRLDYTIIGRGVNTAARLETLAEPGQILISYETYAQVANEIECRKKGDFEVKGIAHPVTAFQVIGPKDRARSDLLLSPQQLTDLSRLELSAMSPEQRDELAVALRRVLERLTGEDGSTP